MTINNANNDQTMINNNNITTINNNKTPQITSKTSIRIGNLGAGAPAPAFMVYS